MTAGLLIAADEFFSNGWRGPTLFRAWAGRLTPVIEPVDRLRSSSEPRWSSSERQRAYRDQEISSRRPAASIPSATRPPTLVDRSTTEADIHIPGTVFAHLTDHHVHLGLIEARALLPGGLTDVTDLGWEPQAAGGWLNSRDPALPAVRIAGGFLTCTGGYPSRSSWAPSGAAIELTAPTDAAGAVSAQAALGASVIKVTLNSVAGPVPSDALLAAIVAAAREHELPVVAHAEGVGQAGRALDAGVTALAHTPFSERLADGVVGRMASAGLVWISTLDIHGWGSKTAAFEVASDNLRRFAAAGGRVLYGTDLGNGRLPAGVNQRELLALAEVGLDGDALVRSIAGSAEEAAFGPRFAWVPGRPPGAARETAHWLATARGCTIDNPASFTTASFTTASPTTEDTIT